MAAWASPGSRVLVVDNGGCSCRVGVAGEADPRVVAPNATARIRSQLEPFVADQIETSIKNQAQLVFTRPCERGVVTNWPCQVEIWQRLFPLALAADQRRAAEHTLAVTVAPFTPAVLTRSLDEIAFEHLGFAGLARLPAPCCSGWLHCQQPAAPDQDARPASLVIDLGFSATTVVPVVGGQAVGPAVRRLAVGGKLLTNFLKELVSFRQYNMMDEVALINQAKEELCYVPTDLPREARRTCGSRVPAQRAAYREWILPDYQTTMKGRVKELPVAEGGYFKRTRHSDRDGEQVLKLEAERFAIPELLFHPPDCGLQQAGLPEVVLQAVTACDPALQGLLYTNMVLTGGSAQFPGLVERLWRALRPLVPDHYDLHIELVEDPQLHAWRGAAQWAATDEFHQTRVVNKAEYDEGGTDYCQRRFGPC